MCIRDSTLPSPLGKERRQTVAAGRNRDELSRGMSDSRPIGVFDSGIGGLTVVKALRDRLPNETIVYLGDTARVPYGPKSPDTVRRYAREIATWLQHQGVKAIVVACNTATAHALSTLQRKFCLLYTSPSPRDRQKSRMPSSA